MFCYSYKPELIQQIFIQLVVFNDYLFFQKSDPRGKTVGVRAPYIRVIGIRIDTEGIGFSSSAIITAEDEDYFRRLAKSPNIYENVSKSVAPSIFGFVDIKKAISCLLFGDKLNCN